MSSMGAIWEKQKPSVESREICIFQTFIKRSRIYSQLRRLRKSQITVNSTTSRTGELPAGVGDLISIDIWGSGGGLPVSAKGNRCVLIIVDHFNSSLYACLVSHEKESTIAKTQVTHLFLEHGIFPKPILTDNGPCFPAKLLDEVNSYLKIKRWYTSAYMGT
ncbi:hypothetical protein QYM36_019265 [Artemia franciscana]|uniref:Integrase catalytic domain-containing protein n=1 Tax=Artemia franciscana TaxID=6661 RepID=A0AA88KZL4_ARTSF|nr:hypothetical protein QYM36_019265 [Artemia franciscana]